MDYTESTKCTKHSISSASSVQENASSAFSVLLEGGTPNKAQDREAGEGNPTSQKTLAI